MERKRFASDEEANNSQDSYDSCTAVADDPDKRNAIKGYAKFATIILLFIAVMLFRTFVFDVVTVSGSSMENSFYENDVLVIKRSTNDVERYDVVVAKMKMFTLIKRVIGLPGETVLIDDGKVYVNGEEITGDFAFFTEDAGIAGEPYTLGEDEYFLLGDNRGNSADSRAYGGVNIEKIKGMVVFRIYPFDAFGRIEEEGK